jgi:hypothetical protein
MKNLKLVFILNVTVVLGIFLAFQAAALDNGLAQTPPMGWNSYNSFTNTINEATVFTASVGVDDETGSNGSVIFQVYGDNQKLFDSGIMTGSSSTQQIDIDTSGVTLLKLYVKIAGDNYSNDHADWGDA